MPAGTTGNNSLGPLYFATFCALSVTLGALLYNLTNVLNEYFTLQQQLNRKQEVWDASGVCTWHAGVAAAGWRRRCLIQRSAVGKGCHGRVPACRRVALC